MNIKRTVGTGKIFWYSCGAVLALAGVVWLIINGVYAVYISGEEPDWDRFYRYTSAADIATPWMLMAASMAICYRYMKICSANSVSYKKQTAVFSLLSVFVSMVFAAADLLFAKLVLQPLYGGIIVTRFEKESTYFNSIIFYYVWSFGEDIPQTISPYTMNTLLLLFALMAVYYYCFFLAGCYIVRCFRYGSRKVHIYYAVMAVLGIIALFVASEIDWNRDMDPNIILALILAAIIIANILTNPVVFLYAFPYLVLGDIETIIIGFVIMTIFTLITIASTESLGLKQFPRKKQLINYNAQNSFKEGGTSQ